MPRSDKPYNKGNKKNKSSEGKKIVEAIVQFGVNQNKKTNKPSIKDIVNDALNVIDESCSINQEQYKRTIQQLNLENVEQFEKRKQKDLAYEGLRIAVAFDLLLLVEELLKRGAPVFSSKQAGNVAHYFFFNGEVPQIFCKENLLFVAVFYGNEEIFKQLFDAFLEAVSDVSEVRLTYEILLQLYNVKMLYENNVIKNLIKVKLDEMKPARDIEIRNLQKCNIL